MKAKPNMTSARTSIDCRRSAAARRSARVLAALGDRQRDLCRKNLPSPGEDLGGEQALHRRAVREARRARPGHPALHLVLAGAGGQGLRAGAADRHAARASCSACRSCSRRASTRSSRSCGRCRRWPGCRWGWCCSRSREPAALFTIAICSMWPTVLNTALGVRSIPQDYLNVAQGAAAVARARRSSRCCCRPRCPTCSPASA